MKKSFVLVLVYVFCFSSINTIANETPLTKLENELMNYVVESIQSSAVEYHKDDNQIKMFEILGHLKRTISSLAHAMVLSPDGKIIAHSDPLKLNEIFDDQATKKVLENRDGTKIFIQKLHLNNREVLDLSLPLYSLQPKEYLGAVRLAIYLK